MCFISITVFSLLCYYMYMILFLLLSIPLMSAGNTFSYKQQCRLCSAWIRITHIKGYKHGHTYALCYAMLCYGVMCDSFGTFIYFEIFLLSGRLWLDTTTRTNWAGTNQTESKEVREDNENILQVQDIYLCALGDAIHTT